MGSPATDIDRLERVLLQRGVGALEADRNRCADCGRTPLTGEYVHLYESPSHRNRPRQSSLVCELCRVLRPAEPVASEVVRHCEHGHTVRFTRAA
jgi:hypothetical protein